MPRGAQGALLRELSARTPDGDLAAFGLLQNEPTATVFLEHRIVGAAREGDRIVSVDAVQAKGGHGRRFRGGLGRRIGQREREDQAQHGHVPR